MVWKEYRVAYWLKEHQESMDRCTDHHDITGICTVENGFTHHTISQLNEPVIKIEDYLLQGFVGKVENKR